MNDLISRSAAIEQVERREKILGGSSLISTRSFKNFLMNRPAVDAEPVRHGRWVKLAYDPTWTKCSECGCNWEWGMVENCNMIFCPNCGATMDEQKAGE